MRNSGPWVRLAAASLAAMATLAVPATAMAAGQRPQAVTPRADLGNTAVVVPYAVCVTTNKDGSSTALFGYWNFDAATVTIPKGVDNNITPASLNAAPPTVFKPGQQPSVFQLNVPKGLTAIWTVNGWPATAALGPWVPACAPVQLPQDGNGYGFIIVLIIAGAIGAYMIHRSPADAAA